MKRRLIAWLLATAAAFVPGLSMAADEAPDAAASERWQFVRDNYFKGRDIVADDGKVVEIDAPVRAEDAAVVPIAIRTKAPQTPQSWVKKLYLVVDKNPSPVGAIFTLTPESGRADIETRVRIEEYSYVRAVAEMNDGKLYMAARFVKASGGCSAPAGKDLAAAMARMGKMKLRLDEDPAAGRPVQAQLMISHPNVSGMGMDQVTRLYPPPHFVRNITVSYAGKPVLQAQVDFSISENPNFRFYFVPTGEGELKAEVVDSKDLKFDSAIEVRPAAAPSGS